MFSLRSRRTAVLVVSAATMFAGIAIGNLRAETIEEVKARLDTLPEITSMQLRATTTGGGEMMQINGTMDLWYQLSDSGVMFRNESAQTVVITAQNMEMQSSTLMVSTPESTYVQTEQMGQTMVRRIDRPEMPPSFSAREQLDQLEESHNLTVVGTETIEGVECTVIRAEAKQAEGGVMTQYIANSNGVPRRMVMEGMGMMGSITTDMVVVSMNEAIDPEKFTYTPPEGVEVMQD